MKFLEKIKERRMYRTLWENSSTKPYKHMEAAVITVPHSSSKIETLKQMATDHGCCMFWQNITKGTDTLTDSIAIIDAISCAHEYPEKNIWFLINDICHANKKIINEINILAEKRQYTDIVIPENIRILLSISGKGDIILKEKNKSLFR